MNTICRRLVQRGTANPATNGPRRVSIIVLALVAATVGCANRGAQVGTSDRGIGNKAAVEAPGELVAEIREEPRPHGPCIDTSRTVSSADSGSFYPPAQSELFLPPLPIPNNVRGFRLIAEFEVSSCGATLVGMSRSPSAKYNRRLQQALRTLKFRPAVAMDGKPVRAKVRIVQEL